MNFITGVDSYKLTHPPLYQARKLYAYFESRGGAFPATIFYGLQGKIKDYLTGSLFDDLDVKDAENFCRRHFNREINLDHWYRLYDQYDGILPIEIKAVPEGTLVPTHNVLFTVESTDEEFAWIVPYIEDILVWTWYPTTVATQSFYLKKELKKLREQFSDNLDGLDFMVHDFGYRGVAGEHVQAGIGASAHLLSFKGTDTTAGIYYLDNNYTGPFSYEKFYDDEWPYMTAFSVPATEHSIRLTCDSDETYIQRLLDMYPTGAVSCVIDTFNMWDTLELLGTTFKDQILTRDGVFVVRPDSGEPLVIVPRVLDELRRYFGAEKNTKGMWVLDPHVRVIYGDGMNRETIPQLYIRLATEGYAPENLIVGSGGGTLQDMTRDTNKFAYKVSYYEDDDRGHNVAKNPVTGPGKKSKRGKLILVDRDGVLTTQNDYFGSTPDNLLQPVFMNGKLLIEQHIDDIRRRVDSYL